MKRATIKSNRLTADRQPVIKPWAIGVLLIGLVGIYFFLPQLSELQGTIAAVRHVSFLWLGLGLCTSATTVALAARMQYVAGKKLGTMRELLTLQLARLFVNSFLPYSLGSVDLAVRYYLRLQKKPTEALTIAILPTIVVAGTTVILLGVISPVTFGSILKNVSVSPEKLWIALSVLVISLVTVIVLPTLRKTINRFLRQLKTDLDVLRDPEQVLPLIGWAVAILIVSATTLLVSVQSAHASIGLADCFTLYITSWIVSNLVPTPGGIGPTEAVLIVGLKAAGVALPDAVVATLVFRLLSFWILIPPGGLAFRKFQRLVAPRPYRR